MEKININTISKNVIVFTDIFAESGIQYTYSIVAFAGPAMNGFLWLITALILKKNLVSRKYVPLVHITKKINMLLFIFNMLPIPGFDGFKVYQGILQTIF